jgi:hypothetical protein
MDAMAHSASGASARRRNADSDNKQRRQLVSDFNERTRQEMAGPHGMGADMKEGEQKVDRVDHLPVVKVSGQPSGGEESAISITRTTTTTGFEKNE